MYKLTNLITIRSKKSIKMKQSQKGKKGFQKTPENEVKSERYNYRLTKQELDTITAYCLENQISKAELFREALNDLFIKKGITLIDTQTSNPNQLRID